MNRDEIARLRNSALPTVARALGYKNDRRDRKRWRRPRLKSSRSTDRSSSIM